MGSRFLVTGVGMSEGRVGVVEVLDAVVLAVVAVVVVVVVVVVVLTSVFLRGLGV